MEPERSYRLSSGGRSVPLWGLAPQLFVLVLLPLTLLLLLATFGGLALHQRAMRMLVGARDERAVRAAAHALLEQATQRRIAVQALAIAAAGPSTPAAPLTPAELDAALAQFDFLLPFFERGLAWFYPDGELLGAAGSESFWRELSVSPPFQAALAAAESQPAATRQAQMTTLTHPGNGELLLVFTYAAPGGPVAVGALTPAALIRPALVDVAPAAQAGAVFVIDREGRVLYQAGQPAEAGNLAAHPGAAEALAGKSGATYLPTAGAEHVVAYSPVPAAHWALVFEEPWAQVATPALALSEQAPLVLVPLAALSVLVLGFAAQQVIRPLRDLEARAARLAWGDFAAIEAPVGGIEEIRHLQGELQHMAHKLRAAQQGLRDYIGAMTHGQEEERRRLARELHDDTLQALIALKQRVQLAELAQAEEAQSAAGAQTAGLQEIGALADQTIQDLRRLTRALRPIYLEDLGLVPALEMLAQEVERANTFTVQFEQRGAPRRLPPATELALYRMAQEALANTARHAHAAQAGVRIVFAAEAVRLQVWDDGRGFFVPDSPAEFAPGGHYGLLGLYERAEMIGARLEIVSQPGAGTTVGVTLGHMAG